MVEQMKAVRLPQNQLHLNPLRVDPWASLEMATIRAAQAIGWDDEIGSREAGRKADIAVFDLDTRWSMVNLRSGGRARSFGPRSRRGASTREHLSSRTVDAPFIRNQRSRRS